MLKEVHVPRSIVSLHSCGVVPFAFCEVAHLVFRWQSHLRERLLIESQMCCQRWCLAEEQHLLSDGKVFRCNKSSERRALTV